VTNPVVSQLIERSNRLGADPRNTNYAGGNTSATGSATDPVTGRPVDLLWVKGSGGDLGTLTEAGLAVEDSVVGVRSAVAAGCPTIGNLLFVAPEEREERAAVLESAGVLAVVSSWQEIADLLLPVLARRDDAPQADGDLLTTGTAR